MKTIFKFIIFVVLMNTYTHANEVKVFDFTKFERLARDQSQGKDLLSQSLPNSMLETHFGLEGNFGGHQSRSFNLPSHAFDESIRPSVWSLDACDGLLVLGCSNGRIELWDVSSGNFKVFLNMLVFILPIS